ncbi:MAG: hypothetical protein KatS3mg129_0780 [Leptospiraceae bacterium]|nr:MAG: hypothetical protein KatS3mg129_0780 [Leptospiraceae bacterium]
MEKQNLDSEKQKLLQSFIEKKGNLIQFNFKKFKNNQLLKFHLNKKYFNTNYTPLQIKKKFYNNLKEINEKINFEDFLHYLNEENLWNENDSILSRIKYYLNKQYGFYKISETLKQELYNENLIQEQLNSISPEIWNNQINHIIEKIKKSNNSLAKEKLQKKIYNKLQYLGYREEEIYNAMKSLK